MGRPLCAGAAGAVGLLLAAAVPAQAQPVLEPPTLRQSSHGHPPYPGEGADGRPARVVLELTLDASGRVQETQLVEVDREGDEAGLFEQAATRYVRTLEFVPATRDGTPVRAQVRFEVLFTPPEHLHPEVPPHAHEELQGHEHGAPPHEHEPPPHEHEPPPHEHEELQEHEHGAPPQPDDGAASPAEEGPQYGAVAAVDQPYQATSSVNLRGSDLRLRPHQGAGDLLNAGTGFYVVQHAGGGKAHQYFLRGFDADHGSDVALFADGVPINAVSHGHGQGYTELHWIIPELVERLEVRKGPYFAEYGDFATAGALNFVLAEDAPASSLTLGGGTYGTYRGLAVISPEADRVVPLVAAEVYGTDGPFDNDEDLQRFNLFGRTTFELGGGTELSLTATSHMSGWNASGQIPLRRVRTGELGRFGAVDPLEGGSTQRHSAYLRLRAPLDTRTEDGVTRTTDALETLLWVAHYRFALYSNFTFFSGEPLRGDMIRQGDRRTTTGLRTSYTASRDVGAVRFDTTVGLQLRFDTIRNSLHAAPGREIDKALVDASVGQGSIGLYASEELSWEWLRLVLGLRGDYFAFSVDDRLEDRSTVGTRSSGERQATIVSPKASVVVTPVEPLELFVNFGSGFHSNDARGVVREPDPVKPLTRGLGYEGGARVELLDRFELSAAFFVLDLESEIVWVGDEGTTEARGETRRLGVEAVAQGEILPWLVADVDASWSRATFVDNPANADAVALAPTFLLNGGLTARHGSGLSARLGVLFVADRPATEDEFLEAQGFTRLDAVVRWERERYALDLSIFNLLNTNWRAAQFATTSRLPSETEPASCPGGTRPVEEEGTFLGCEDVNFTPGWPIHVQGSATVFF